MPVALRSGPVNEVMKRKFLSGYSIYVDKRLQELTKKLPDKKKSELREIIKKDWSNLSPSQQKAYDDQFEKEELAYKEKVILSLGGTQNDVKNLKQLEAIPDKPKKPVAAPLNYLQDARKKVEGVINKEYQVQDSNPALSAQEVAKQCVDQYHKLSDKERQKYEDKYKAAFETYKIDIEKWKKKHSGKSDQLEELMFQKFRRANKDDKFVYQELDRERQRRPRDLTKKATKIKAK